MEGLQIIIALGFLIFANAGRLSPIDAPVGAPPLPVGIPPITLPPIGVPPVGVLPPIGLPPVGVALPPVGVAVPPVTLPPIGLPPVGVAVPPVGVPPVTLPPVTLPPIAVPPVGVAVPPVGAPTSQPPPPSSTPRPPPPVGGTTPQPPPPKDGCFPGDAMVQTIDGAYTRISDIKLGDQVAVGHGPHGVIYSEVYAFGHKNSDVVSEFVRVMVGSSGVLELTEGHFVPVSSEGRLLHKRAGELRVGDALHGLTDNASLVTGISLIAKRGLYNPFTLSGSIIVNNIEASVHSEWFLDSTFDLIGKAHWLPKVYQILLAPARLLYRMVNRELYVKGYNILDACFNFSELGGSVQAKDMAAAATFGVIASLVLANKHRTTKKN